TTSGNSNADLVLSHASLLGDIVNAAGSNTTVVLQDQSVFKGITQNVSSVAVNSGAQWVLGGDSSVTAMSLDGGTVALGAEKQFYTLNLGSLQGSGTFALSADFTQLKNSFLDISGRADGNFGLLINASGTDPIDGASLHVVHAGSGNAQFSLVGDTVDLGTWSYSLTQVRNDWYLDASTRTISPGTQSVLALFNTAPTVWYGELSSLRSRMGELRLTDGQAGGWVRTYGNKFNVSDASGMGYQQNQQGI
ncbi:MAG: pertactin-like passenger domain-containing protein, partial [Negativicutes bacterium]|nr:pertactin-like passenger domain-containing protein [Negativicutes bacterium]